MHPFVVTPRTPLSYDTCSLALVARTSKHLTHHTHHFLNHHSPSMTARTLHGTRLTMLRYRYLDRLVCTSVHLLERQVNRMVPITILLLLWWTTHTTKHVLENFRNVWTVSLWLLLRVIGSKLVVACTSFRVIQDFVCPSNLLELFSVASLVWVIDSCQISVRLSNLIHRCVFIHIECFVVTHTDKERSKL